MHERRRRSSATVTDSPHDRLMSQETVVDQPQTAAPASEPADFASDPRPRSFGDYELLEEIAHGGMGVVYKARQRSLNREVALKMILRGKYAGTREVKRFLAEARAAAHLNHPNIVAIHEVGQHEEQHYFSMQLIEGRSLAQQIQSGEWPVDEGEAAARLLAKVARAVHYAHQEGILHRDLKPANILLDAQGEPHLADFGLARQLCDDSTLTMEGAIIGTPAFMAPEQASGKGRALTPAADIYSLGAILYCLVTGRPPFVSESVLDILAQVLERQAMLPSSINPRLAREVEQICQRCLEKAPEHRYASALELADDLDQFLRGDPIAAPPMTPGLRLQQWARQRPALVSRLVGLSLSAGIAQAGYNLMHLVPLHFHLEVMSVLAIWALVSVLCQSAISRGRWPTGVRYVWAGADAGLLTALLYIDEAFDGPLIVVYPVLIAGSGLWFRIGLVFYVTILSVLGYTLLLFDHRWRHGPLEQPNWHVIFLFALVLTGALIIYLVHRVQVLSRFYGSRLCS
jgi:eukaryotic-like serine/threonine-protein kinase